MISLVVLIVSVLFISGLCSMTEAAILSLPFVKARILLENRRKGARTTLFIKENIHTAVATIVILNNCVNIVGSIFVGQIATSLFGSRWLGITSAILTFTIIVVSEVIPKTIGERYKVAISLASAKPLSTIMWLFKPLVGFIVFITSPFNKKFKLPQITEQEIKAMMRLGRDEGTIEADEETLCNRVFKLNDLKAYQMMKPLHEIYSLAINRSLLEVKDKVINSLYSRIIVYDKVISNIIGVCQQRVLLREIAKDNYKAKVGDFMLRPIFVDENERADRLLEKFQAYKQHLFIVQNSRKKNIGILTMEDVLEELFGEIYDERETHGRIK